MGFVEAVHDLAGQYGMQVPEDDASPAGARPRRRAAPEAGHADRRARKGRRGLPQAAAPVARAPSTTSRAAASRARSPSSSASAMRPKAGARLASVFPDYDDPLLAESGLVIVGEADDNGDGKRYDRFRDRVMFPIRNVKGECIGFGGRVLGDEKPKYLNSPETPVFSKGRELYGLFEARAALRDQRLRAGDRGLHGRGRAGAAGLSERGRHAGHGLHARARAEAVPLHRFGGVQLRRRRRRPPRRAQGAGRRPALCHRRAQRQVPVPAGRARSRTASSASSAPSLRALRERGHAAAAAS